MSGVGGSSIANAANTTPGNSLGVEAATYAGGAVGAGVGGGGVVDLFSGGAPHSGSSLLLESSSYFLLEDGTSTLLLEA